MRETAPPLTAPAILDVDAVAALLNKSPKQVYNMRERGQLPPALKQRAGFRLCWRRTDIEAWLASLPTET